MEDEKECLLKQVRYLVNQNGELPFNPSRWWLHGATNEDLHILVEYNRYSDDIKIIDRQNLYKKD